MGFSPPPRDGCETNFGRGGKIQQNGMTGGEGWKTHAAGVRPSPGRSNVKPPRRPGRRPRLPPANLAAPGDGRTPFPKFASRLRGIFKKRDGTALFEKSSWARRTFNKNHSIVGPAPSAISAGLEASALRQAGCLPKFARCPLHTPPRRTTLLSGQADAFFPPHDITRDDHFSDHGQFNARWRFQGWRGCHHQFTRF